MCSSPSRAATAALRLRRRDVCGTLVAVCLRESANL
jgi:hypothetical protein